MDGDLNAFSICSKVTPFHIGFMLGKPDTIFNENLKSAKFFALGDHLYIFEQVAVSTISKMQVHSILNLHTRSHESFQNWTSRGKVNSELRRHYSRL